VNLHRTDAKSLLLFVSLVSTALWAGCATPKVGAPCLPEQVPDTGFAESESYVESSSVQCETRVCLVFHLAGDPEEGCVPRECGPKDKDCVAKKCADATEVSNRVYCTCRCDAKGSGFDECECPDGYSCTPVLEQGGPGVRGSYCVKTSTSNQL
jgi:hypothetical protein